jgi:hypothetical protein
VRRRLVEPSVAESKQSYSRLLDAYLEELAATM